MPFDPNDRANSRPRGQVLYRYRPAQTFDHAGGYIAQVRQYAPDDAYQGVVLDHAHLIREAMRLVRRWRAEGATAPASGDRAPEFPADDPLAHVHYDVVIPGRVFSRVWPRVVRCSKPRCGAVWEARDPRFGIDEFPPACPRCNNPNDNRQLQFLFAHQCGEAQAMHPPRQCPRGHTGAFRLDDQVSRFKDFRWECIECGTNLMVQAFCGNPGCQWPDKRMAPVLHTAGSAHVGQNLTLVNVTTAEEARRQNHPDYAAAVLAMWLGELTEDEYARITDAATVEVPREVLDSIQAMEDAGLHDQAHALRARFVPGDSAEIAGRVRTRLGLDPDSDRARTLAAHLTSYRQVRNLDTISLDRLLREARTDDRRTRYRSYPTVLVGAGMTADTCLVSNFPVTNLAVGYSRAGFTPAEADLVPYRGRATRGGPQSTLLYAHPTEAEALLFVLDRDRVGRWMTANNLLDEQTLADAGGVHRWFARQLDPDYGHLPTDGPRPPDGHPDLAAYELFGLLHTISHQLLRALAVDSGYNETSLSEYLFPFDLAFALYPSGGRDFSIGALRTVLEQNLDAVVTRAVDNDACLYDPNCLLTDGADHGCLLLPETACRAWNRNLTRWHLFGRPDGSGIGYWDPALG